MKVVQGLKMSALMQRKEIPMVDDEWQDAA